MNTLSIDQFTNDPLPSLIIILCPQCMIHLSSIQIFNENIRISCTNCQNTIITLIPDYIEMMKKKQNTNHNCTFHQSHSGRPSVNYCINCSKWLCQECITLHIKNTSLSKHLKTSKEVVNYNTKSFKYYCLKCESPIEKDECEIEVHKVIKFKTMKEEIKALLTQDQLALVEKCENKIIKDLIQLIINNYYMFKDYNLYEPLRNVICNINECKRKETIMNEKTEGYDVHIYDNGGKYEGYWKNHKRHGKGKMTWLDGDSYDGDWIDDIRKGYGVYKNNDGRKYEGYWNDDTREGYGIYIFNDGSKYKGYWKNDKQHGKGKLTLKDGVSYHGEWVDNNKEGFGVYIYENGAKYQGYWKNNKKYGLGKLTLLNGESYEGDLIDNKREGYGIHIYSNGSKYEGYWKNHKFHGSGILTMIDGASYDGDWVNNKREGYGEMIYNNGEEFSGHWKNDKKHGKGKFSFSNATHSGEWIDGKPRTDCISIFNENGIIYEGNYKNDNMNEINKLTQLSDKPFNDNQVNNE